MSKPLSSSQVEHLLPILPYLAGVVRDHGELNREDLQVFLVSKGMEEEWALVELLNWSRALASLPQNADNRRRQIVQAALQARGVTEASAFLAVETVAGPSRPEVAGTALPIHVTTRYLDMGQLHPSQSAQATLVVSGGPGIARSNLDRIRIGPERFGPQDTSLTISVAKMLPEELVLGEVVLDSGHETVRVEVSVRWTNQRSDLFGDLLPDGAFQRLGTVRLRHLDDNWMDTKVYEVALSPDGKVLASASRDASEPEHLLAGGFYMNPTLGSVQLWDVTTGVRLLHIREHDPSVQPMTFTPDGRFLYEGGHGGSVRFWNVQTLQPSVQLQGLRPEFDEEEKPDLGDLFARFQDGRRIVAANHKTGDKQRVEVWDLELVQLLHKLETDWQPIHSVRVAGQDRVVLVELEETRPDEDEDEEEAEAVLLVWDLEKDEVIHRVPGGWRNARLSKDGLNLQITEASGNKKISLPTSSKVVTPTLAGETPSRQAVLVGKALSIVERASNKVVLEAAGHKDWVTAIVALPDGKHLATASTDGTVQLWNWHTGELVETLVEEPDEKMMALALSPDGQILAAAGTSGMVSVYDLSQKGLKCSWLASEKTINALLFFDPDTLFLGGDDGSVTAWGISEETAQGDVLSGPVRFDALALTPDRRLVAKSIGGEIVVLDLNEERPEVQHVFRIENETWSLMAVTPNGATVVLPESGRRLRPVHLEGESRVGFQYQSVLRRWNAISGEQLEDFRLHADSVRAFSLAFSPDGDSLAVGDQEGRVFLLDAHTGVEKQFWMGHQAMVCSVAFLDNRTLASGGADTTILIWRFDPEKTTGAKEVSSLGGDQETRRREALRLFAKGDSYIKQGELDKALDALTHGIQLDPQLADAYNHRGVVYARKGEFDKALADITKAITLAPDKEALFLRNRGDVHASKGDNTSAIEDFTRVIELNPASHKAYSDRGLSYFQMGDYPKALADMGKAISLSPDNTKALFNRILVHEKMGNHAEAIADLTRLMEMDPGHPQLLEKRGRLSLMVGQYQNALNDFNEILQKDKGNAVILALRDQALQALDGK